VIVEGANLFITPGARRRLCERGAVIFKDSSANKAGVICSSYEIVASMLLDEAGFLDIKERYVAEVLDELRTLARQEAQILFREHLHKPAVDLPELSERLSLAINRATDVLTGHLAALWKRHPEALREVVLRHLPGVRVEQCGERIFQAIPRTYLERVVASSLASRMVYREGLDWLESMPDAPVARLAERYLLEEARVRRLVDQVRASQLEDRERIAALLEIGGVTAALRSSAT
jgi:glutamate dehydrogenase